MQDYYGEDTIIALSTPVGKGAIAVIRMSGSLSLDLISHTFSRPIGKDQHRLAVTGEFYTDEPQRIIDECVVVYFRAPNSYTGEDVIEISCHEDVRRFSHTSRNLR